MDRKKYYEKAEVKVFRADPLDVITTSGKEVDLDPNAAAKEIGLEWKW